MSELGTVAFLCLVLRGFRGSCSLMAKRKQARPSRPSGSTAPTNVNVLNEHVENEEDGKLAAVHEDAEEIPGVSNDVKQATRRNSRKRGRFKNTLGNLWTRAFHVFSELLSKVYFKESERLYMIKLIVSLEISVSFWVF